MADPDIVIFNPTDSIQVNLLGPGLIGPVGATGPAGPTGLVGIYYRPEDYGAVGDGSTNDLTAFNTMHTALQAAKGGTVLLSAKTYLLSGALVLPNDGTGSVPHQVPIVYQGVGSAWSGESGVYAGGSIFDIRTSDSKGHVQTYGLGHLTFRDLQITDGGTSNANPFVFTTNTTVHARGIAIIGSPGLNGTTNDQDAFVFGGTTITDDGTAAAGFQGYGSGIYECQFDRIRRLLNIRVFANTINIQNNWVERNSGNPTGNGELILVDGSAGGLAAGQYAVGINIHNNNVEISNYKYFVHIDYGEYVNITGNALFDETTTTLAAVHMTANASDIYVEASLCTGKPYLAGTTSSCTFISQAGDGTPSLFPAGVGPLTINGNFTATGSTCQIGTAGSTNNLQFLQTVGIAKISADGTDFEIANAASGNMFFDNSGSGGQFWFRTTGFATVLDYGHTAAGKWTYSKPLVTFASATGGAGLNLPSGTAPTSPVDGDLWYDGTNLKFRVGGTTKTVTLT